MTPAVGRHCDACAPEAVAQNEGEPMQQVDLIAQLQTHINAARKAGANVAELPLDNLGAVVARVRNLEFALRVSEATARAAVDQYEAMVAKFDSLGAARAEVDVTLANQQGAHQEALNELKATQERLCETEAELDKLDRAVEACRRYFDHCRRVSLSARGAGCDSAEMDVRMSLMNEAAASVLDGDRHLPSGDSRLAAAAPDLLAACRAVLSSPTHGDTPSSEAVEMVRDAIAKATGEEY